MKSFKHTLICCCAIQ